MTLPIIRSKCFIDGGTSSNRGRSARDLYGQDPAARSRPQLLPARHKPSLNLNGAISQSSSLAVQLQANDLRRSRIHCRSLPYTSTWSIDATAWSCRHCFVHWRRPRFSLGAASHGPVRGAESSISGFVVEDGPHQCRCEPFERELCNMRNSTQPRKAVLHLTPALNCTNGLSPNQVPCSFSSMHRSSTSANSPNLQDSRFLQPVTSPQTSRCMAAF